MQTSIYLLFYLLIPLVDLLTVQCVRCNSMLVISVIKLTDHNLSTTKMAKF